MISVTLVNTSGTTLCNEGIRGQSACVFMLQHSRAYREEDLKAGPSLVDLSQSGTLIDFDKLLSYDPLKCSVCSLCVYPMQLTLVDLSLAYLGRASGNTVVIL